MISAGFGIDDLHLHRQLKARLTKFSIGYIAYCMPICTLKWPSKPKALYASIVPFFSLRECSTNGAHSSTCTHSLPKILTVDERAVCAPEFADQRAESARVRAQSNFNPTMIDRNSWTGRSKSTHKHCTITIILPSFVFSMSRYCRVQENLCVHIQEQMRK